jgi:hypothetical protein
MMHLNNSIRYKRSFVNINPQSNTDFTQVTCTVHFYYNFVLHYDKIVLFKIKNVTQKNDNRWQIAL